MLHLTCAHGLCVNVIQLLDFQSCLSGDSQCLPQSQEVEGFLVMDETGKLLAVLFYHLDTFSCHVRRVQQALSDLLDGREFCRRFLFCDKSTVVNQVQNLMEKAFCGCYRYFSTNFYVDWVIGFPGQSWSLYIDDAYSLDVFLLVTLLHDVNQVFGLPWLADHHHRFVVSDVFRL